MTNIFCRIIIPVQHDFLYYIIIQHDFFIIFTNIYITHTFSRLFSDNWSEISTYCHIKDFAMTFRPLEFNN